MIYLFIEAHNEKIKTAHESFHHGNKYGRHKQMSLIKKKLVEGFNTTVSFENIDMLLK